MDRHFETFQRVYDERFQAKYGYWRPIIERSVTAFLRCGDLHEGFARVRCGDCGHEMFVAFSCKQRCTCPSCHQKRTLLTAIHVAEDVCAPVAHRQVVLTIPKRLRVHTRFDRKLLARFPGARSAGFLRRVHAAHSAEGRAPDPRAPTEGWSRLVLEQGPRDASQGGGATGRGIEKRDPGASGPQPMQPDVGDAHQAGVRDRPTGLPRCGGQMKVIALIEPAQGAVIEKILRHCGLLIPSTPRAPPTADGWVYDPDGDWDSQPASSDPPGDLTYVDMDEFLATF